MCLLPVSDFFYIRSALGFSVERAADFFHVATSTWSRWENGKSLPCKYKSALIRSCKNFLVLNKSRLHYVKLLVNRVYTLEQKFLLFSDRI